MRYAQAALMFLRVGIGLYLVFAAVTRLMGLQSLSSFNSMYGWMGGSTPVSQSGFAIAASIFLGILGLALLSGRLLVVSGVLVAIVGLTSGLSEIVASQTVAVNAVDGFTRLSNGVRDVLVLGSTGGAIAALDSFIRHRRHRDAQGRVTMYREERTQAETPVGSTTRTTTIDEPPTRYF